MTHLAQSLSILSVYACKIASWAEELATEYKRARNIANTINELNRLSDAELRDIGISRGEIYDIARETHSGERF